MTITSGSTGVAGLETSSDNHTLLCVVDRAPDNLFSGAMIDELVGAIKEAEGDSNLRFVRVRARGEAFCLGRDRTAATSQEFQTEAARIVAINELFKSTPLTVALELQGDAAGFGAGLVGGADIVVAAEGAGIYFPEILGGLAPTVVIGWLGYAIPYKHAFHLVASGQRIDAREAADLGLVTTVVAAADVVSSMDEMIELLAGHSAEGLREIKSFFATTRSLHPPAAATASVDALVLSALRLRSERT